MKDKALEHALEKALNKLGDLLLLDGWTAKIYKEKYPIKFVFEKGQTDMKLPAFETREKPPEISLIFGASLTYILDIPENESIDEKFFNSLKNLCKEATRLFHQVYFMRATTSDEEEPRVGYEPFIYIGQCKYCGRNLRVCLKCGNIYCIACDKKCDCTVDGQADQAGEEDQSESMEVQFQLPAAEEAEQVAKTICFNCGQELIECETCGNNYCSECGHCKCEDTEDLPEETEKEEQAETEDEVQ